MLEAIHALDVATLHAVQSVLDPYSFFFSLVTFLGHPVFWFLVAAVLLWKGREKESFFLVNLIAVASAVAGALKWLVAKPRPSPEQFATHWDPLTSNQFEKQFNFSFPSGHTTTVTTVLAYYWQKHQRKVQAAGVVVVLLVALSRMVLGKHFLSEVIAGILLGAILGTICLKFQESFRKHDFRLSRLKSEAIVVLIVLAALVASFFSVSLGLVALLLGYYAGFFAGKELEHAHLPQAEWLLVIGLLGFGLLGVAGYWFTDGLAQDLVFFLAGLWVSLLWPLLATKAFKNALTPQ